MLNSLKTFVEAEAQNRITYLLESGLRSNRDKWKVAYKEYLRSTADTKSRFDFYDQSNYISPNLWKYLNGNVMVKLLPKIYVASGISG